MAPEEYSRIPSLRSLLLSAEIRARSAQAEAAAIAEAGLPSRPVDSSSKAWVSGSRKPPGILVGLRLMHDWLLFSVEPDVIH